MLPYTTVGELVVTKSIDIRDNAIESARQSINRKLVKTLGKEGFFMKVRVYPSHLLRENKQAQGAGADRVSQGMSRSFGATIGRATRVRAGQTIFSVLCMETQKNLVKEALRSARTKFPCSVKVEFHNDVKGIGTIPTKVVEEKAAAAKVETPTEGTATPEAGKAPAAGTKPEAGKEATATKTDTKATAPAAKKK